MRVAASFVDGAWVWRSDIDLPEHEIFRFLFAFAFSLQGNRRRFLCPTLAAPVSFLGIHGRSTVGNRTKFDFSENEDQGTGVMAVHCLLLALPDQSPSAVIEMSRRLMLGDQTRERHMRGLSRIMLLRGGVHRACNPA